MVFLLIASIVVPQLLGALRFAYDSPEIIFGQKVYKTKKNRILFSILIVVSCPFHVAFLILKKSYIEVQLRKYPLSPILNIDWETTKYHLCQHVRLELGLETIFQLSGQLILIFNAVTTTGTHEGLDKIFEEGSTQFAIILLSLSSLWSFISCSRSNLKALSSNREHFPMISKLVAGFYALFACSVRVLAFVMFFAPALGLFDLLKHLQAEQTQWDPNIIKNFVDNDGTILFGNVSSPIPWNKIDRWSNVTDVSGIHEVILQPPHYKLYTTFNLLQYFYIFWIILFIQGIFVYMAKWKYSFSFAKSSWLEKIIHVMENIHVPYNFEEWDTKKYGGVETHLERMKQNGKEVNLVMMVNFVFNCLLLIPLGVLGMYILMHLKLIQKHK